MKQTYKIKITFFDEKKVKYIQANFDKISKKKNIINYINSRYDNIKQIVVFCYNENTSKYYKELCYNNILEHWLKNHCRIEATNPKGHEDFTGYGGKTDGKKNRFRIGRSTGWIPIYLEILQSNSTGGGALFIIPKRIFQAIDNPGNTYTFKL